VLREVLCVLIVYVSIIHSRKRGRKVIIVMDKYGGGGGGMI
jgi:hypothetical protein